MSHRYALAPWLCALLVGGIGVSGCAVEETPPDGDTGDGGDDVNSDGGDVPGPDSDDDSALDVPDTTDLPEDAAPDSSDTADTADDASDGDVPAPDSDDAADLSDPDTAHDATPDADAADIDPDVLDACLEACGIGCLPPEYAPCGVDGNLYCSECEMACRGIAVAADRSVCGTPSTACDPPADAEALAWTEWSPPADCFVETMGFRGELTSEVFAEESALEGVMDCADSNTLSGIDWSTHRLVRAVVSENPVIELRGVTLLDGRVTVHAASPVYCGGAPPPDSAAYLLIPAGTDPVDVSGCRWGRCPDGPPRP